MLDVCAERFWCLTAIIRTQTTSTRQHHPTPHTTVALYKLCIYTMYYSILAGINTVILYVA